MGSYLSGSLPNRLVVSIVIVCQQRVQGVSLGFCEILWVIVVT
jgi:hypothetical protein